MSIRLDETKQSKTKKEELLSLCQNASDCLFEVIEHYPDPSLEKQMGLCKKIQLQHYSEDCQRFALERAYAKGFTDSDIATFFKLYNQKPKLIAVDDFAGTLQECTTNSRVHHLVHEVQIE